MTDRTLAPTPQQPESDRGRRRPSSTTRRGLVWVSRVVVVVGLLAIWELISGRLVSDFFISSPSGVGARLYDWFSSGYIYSHIAITMKETVVGFAIGGASAIVVGVALGRMRFLSDVLSPYVTAVYGIPKLALAPLFILWFGIGLESKVVLVALNTFFLVFFNTFRGVRSVDAIYVQAVTLMGGSRGQVVRKVLVPSAAAWVFTGFKLATPYALIGAIVGELISSNRGLGFVLSNSASLFDTAGVLSALVIIAVISVSMNELVGLAEGRALRWQGSGERK